MAKQSFSVPMVFENKTAGGQHRFFVPQDKKEGAGMTNAYITKNAFPPGVNPTEIEVTVTYDDGK